MTTSRRGFQLLGGDLAAVTALNNLEALLSQHQWGLIELGGLTVVSTGTGSSNILARFAQQATGATAGSTNLARTPGDDGWSAGSDRRIINWSTVVAFAVSLNVEAASANGIYRMTVGKDTTAGAGALANRGIGIQIANLVLSGLAHNGTVLDTVSLATTLVASRATQIVMVSDGLGTVHWLVNGVLVGTSTGGPTGAGLDGDTAFQIEIVNGADASNNVAETNEARYLVEV